MLQMTVLYFVFFFLFRTIQERTPAQDRELRSDVVIYESEHTNFLVRKIMTRSGGRERQARSLAKEKGFIREGGHID